jgi:hypothetical protein
MNENILSVIARYADIDTRRAMGFPPRKLVIPSLNIRIPEEQKSGHLFRIEFDSGIKLILWPYKDLSYETKWIINGNTTSSLFIKNGYTEISRNKWKPNSERYTHPDFNKDGSFKRFRL